MRAFTLSLLLVVVWLISLHPCLGSPTVMNYNCNPSVSWSLSGCFNHGTEMKSRQEWTHALILGLFFSLLYTVFFFFWNVSHRMWLGSWRSSISGGLLLSLFLLGGVTHWRKKKTHQVRVIWQSSGEQWVSGLMESCLLDEPPWWFVISSNKYALFLSSAWVCSQPALAEICCVWRNIRGSPCHCI